MIDEIGGRRVFPIGLGTYGMGGRSTPSRDSDDLHVNAIKYALKHGINVIDTAEMYGSGHTEELVGRAIRDFPRERYFIISKVWPTHLSKNDVFAAAQGSLERLDIDQIDLYLIHWPSRSIPLDETIMALMDIRDRGMVKNIGVSNFDLELLQDAIDYAGKGSIVADEIEMNYDTRSRDSQLVEFCRKNNIAVIAYSPLSRGRLIGNEKVRQIAAKYGKTELQICLRYIMEMSLPIPKSSSTNHIDEIIDSASIKLTQEDKDLLK